MRLVYVLFFSCLWCAMSAQTLQNIAGVVVDETGAGLPKAQVYFNNTSFYTESAIDGSFELLAESGTYQLVIFSPGFEANLQWVQTDTLQELRVQLEPLRVDLAPISVEATRDQAWYENLELFKQGLLGTSTNASKCKILNAEVLVLDRQQHQLQAYAREILQIENPRLGYQIAFLLTSFVLDLEAKTIRYAGYAHFKETSRENNIQKRRSKAYAGSVQQLLQTITDTTNGFEVYPLIRVLNPDKPNRDTLRIIEQQLQAYRNKLGPKPNANVLDLYSRRNDPDSIEVVDSIQWQSAKYLKKTRYGYLLEGPLDLHIRFPEKPAALFNQQYGYTENEQISHLTMLEGDRVEILETGELRPPDAVEFTGYLGWRRLGDQLPIDYRIP